MNAFTLARAGLRILPKSPTPAKSSVVNDSVPSSTNGRSALLISILSFNTILHLAGFFAFYHLCPSWVHLLRLENHSLRDWQTILMFIVFANGAFNTLTALSPLSTRFSEPPRRRTWSSLTLLLVTKGQNREVVLRSVGEMRALTQLDKRIRFVVLTEEGRDFDAEKLDVEVVFIPHWYVAPLARYKARSLEYFRKLQALKTNDWVLHLDEETGVDEHCIRACIDFIERTGYEWGQGIKVYNTINYWQNPILTFAEVSRFRDDLTCFNFQHAMLHRTIWGCHGSFLLASGKIENLVTWDTSSLAEDYWFGLKASQLGYGSGWIPSVAREQANWLLSDYFYQRRRWFWGIWSIGSFGRFRAITWVLSSLEVPVFILSAAGLLTVPTWLATPLHIYSTSTIFSLLFAMLLQDLDAGVSILRIAWHLVIGPFLIGIVSCLQTIVIFASILRPASGFHIVKKK